MKIFLGFEFPAPGAVRSGVCPRRIAGIARICAVVGAWIALAGAGHAQTNLFWDRDNNNSTLGAGNGTWTTSIGNGNDRAWNSSSNGTNGTRTDWTNGANAFFVTSGTSAVTVSGTVDVNSITFDGTGYTVGGTTLTLTGDGNITTNAAGTINAPIAGTVGLTKLGAATLTLGGANTYTGTTTINAGTLALSGSGSLADSAAVNVNSATGVFSISAITATSETIGSLAGVASSSVVLGSKNLTVGDATNTTFAGVISGTGGSLTKQGAGTLTLSGANTYTGATTLTAGRLTINGTTQTGSVSVASGAILDLSHSAALGGASSLTFANGAVLDNSTAGLVAISNNTMTKSLTGTFTYLGSTGQNISLGGGTTTLVGNMTFDVKAAELTFNSPTTASGISITKVGDGLLRFTGLQTGALAGVSYVNEGTLRIAGSSVIDSGVDIRVATGATLSLDGTITWGGNAINDGGSIITDFIQNTDVIFAANTVLNTSAGNFNGRQTINAGVTVSSVSDRLGTTPGTFVSDRIVMNTGSTLTSLGNISIHQNKGILLQGNATLATTADFSTTVHSVISGTAGLTIAGGGAGFVELLGANTYTGVTTLAGGTLKVATIGDGGVAGGLGQATNAATNIVFDGGTLQYTGANATSDRAFTINAGKTATIETANDISFAGATGATTDGALTKTGAGTLTLTGANTYTGTTTISAGTLALGASGSIANSSLVTIASGATLNVGAVTGGWSLGSGQALSGSGTLSGNTTIAGGAIVDAVGTLTASGNLTFNSGSVFNWSMTDETTFDRISGANFGGSGGLFNVVADVNTSFWEADRTFADIFAGTGSSLASIFSTIQLNGSSLTGGVVADRGTFTISGNDLNWTAIPEPATTLAGMLIFAGLMRRRR